MGNPASDLLSAHGATFLGSRLKRLGERMHSGAARLLLDAGLEFQPVHVPFLMALEHKALTVGQLVQAVGLSQPGVTRAVGQLVEFGLVESKPGKDQRQRTISLTSAGHSSLSRVRKEVLPRVDRAVQTLLGGDAMGFLNQIDMLEQTLDNTTLHELAQAPKLGKLQILEYSEALAPYFYELNAEWIETMFSLEQADIDVLKHPQESILDKGGVILFVEAEGVGIVGTAALQKNPDGSVELMKMAVRSTARGLKAGEFLLRAIIDRALSMDAEPLFLLSNYKCAAAVHLYEKNGFQHDSEIMERCGAKYDRCDVAMRYRPVPV